MEELNFLTDVLKSATAMSADPDFSPREVQAWIQQQTGGQYPSARKVLERVIALENAPGKTATAAAGFLQGISFGTFDDIMAGMAHVLPGGATAQDVRDKFDEATTMNPKTMLVADIIGGIANPYTVPGLSGAAQGATRAARIAKGAGKGLLRGGIEGSVEGFARSEGGITERLRGAGLGATVGALAGGTLSAGGGALQKGVSPEDIAGTTSRRVAQTAADESGGVDEVLETYTQLKRVNPDITLADVEAMEGAARFAARHSADARFALRSRFNRRSQGSINRIVDMITGGTGTNAADALARHQQIAARLGEASAAFKALDGTFTNLNARSIDNALETLTNQKSKLTAIARKELQDLGSIVDGNFKPSGLMGFEDLQGLKRTLDDDITELFRKGRSKQALDVMEMRNTLNDTILETVEGFGDANSSWARIMRESDAFADGASSLTRKVDADEATALWERAVASGNADSYRQGAVAGLLSDLSMRADDASVGKFLANSQEATTRLRRVFPDDETFQRFLTQLDSEQAISQAQRRLASDVRPRVPSRAEALGTPEPGAGLGIPFPTKTGVAIGGLRKGAGALTERTNRARALAADQAGTALERSMSGSGADVNNLLRGATQPGGVKLSEMLNRGPRGILTGLFSNREREER